MPISNVAKRKRKAPSSSTGLPSTVSTTSPGLSPASAAGCAPATSSTATPLGLASPSFLAEDAVTERPMAPSQGRTMLVPVAPPPASTARIKALGMAKPMPTDPAALGIERRIDAHQLAVEADQRTAGIARIDRSIGLDEGPVGVDAAHVAGQGRDDAVGHGLATPKGLPMASTISPTSNSSESRISR